MLVLAHRGSSDGGGGGLLPGGRAARENTLEAFAAARRLGADGVELDVRRTADGVLVVHHDAEVPGVGPIANVDRRDLPPWVPTLDEALESCAGVLVDVEVKHEAAVDPGRELAAAVAAALAGRPPWAAAPGPGRTPAGVLVSSFDPGSLAVVTERAPEVPTGLLVDWTADAREALAAARRLGCTALHPFVTQVDASLVAAARGAAMALHVWTVNADADLAAMAALGADAVITDRVATALASAGRRPRNGEAGAGSSTIGP